MEQFKRIP